MIVHLHRFFLGLFRIVAVGIEFVDRVFTRFEDEKLALANELADLVDSQNDVLIDFPDVKWVGIGAWKSRVRICSKRWLIHKAALN